jgi:hypothetical protein
MTMPKNEQKWLNENNIIKTNAKTSDASLVLQFIVKNKAQNVRQNMSPLVLGCVFGQTLNTALNNPV